MIVRQLLQRFQRIINHHGTRVALQIAVFGDNIFCALFQHFSSEFVAVEVRALQAHEEAIRRQIPAVRADARGLLVFFV